MAEEAKKLKESLVQSSSSTGATDKDKVARLAGMIKKLHQLKSEYKKADSTNEQKAARQKVVAFTQKWLDEKLLQLVEWTELPVYWHSVCTQNNKIHL